MAILNRLIVGKILKKLHKKHSPRNDQNESIKHRFEESNDDLLGQKGRARHGIFHL